MVGAHLDSVAEGPGINDNGSGSAAILEVAEQMAKVKPPTSCGSPGGVPRSSTCSARSSTSAACWTERRAHQLDDIALYLNFDMVASPNFGRFVYDGDGPDEAPPGPAARCHRAGVQPVLRLPSLAYLPTPFDGRSDYGPFIAVGIPAGGLFTGAEDIKPPEEVPLFGGTAGVAYDKCYHQACDTLANISWRASTRCPMPWPTPSGPSPRARSSWTPARSRRPERGLRPAPSPARRGPVASS